MRLVLGDDANVAVWVAAKLGIPGFVPPYVAMGVVDGEGLLCGGMIFNSFTGWSIEITVAGSACARRSFIRAALDFAFRQNGVLHLRCRTRLSNVHIRNQLLRLGFRSEGTLKNYFGPGPANHAAMFALSRHRASRWLGDIHGIA